MKNRLDQKAFSVAQRALSEASAAEISSPRLLSDRIFIRQLQRWVKDQTRLSPVQGEKSGLFLDRLLLWHAPSYRHARELAHDLGISLKPRFYSGARSLMEFDPLSPDVYFFPLAEEIEWALSDKRLSIHDSARLVDQLSLFASSVYHDLNHAILARVFRVSRPGPPFWALMESLAKLRDTELAAETGSAAPSLQRAGILYSSFPARARGKLDERIFSAFILAAQGAVLQMPKRFINESLALAGLPARLGPVFNRKFLSQTVPSWQNAYRFAKSRSPSFPKPRSRAVPILRLSRADPRYLAESPELRATLWQWYESVFRAQQ